MKFGVEIEYDLDKLLLPTYLPVARKRSRGQMLALIISRRAMSLLTISDINLLVRIVLRVKISALLLWYASCSLKKQGTRKVEVTRRDILFAVRCTSEGAQWRKWNVEILAELE